ncbi:MAG: protein-tyrosine-phosphatase [Lachnospiraceae bacterium]|nr:protein-tyrosine-phosphatase [Lachnospiraceae bacterium]
MAINESINTMPIADSHCHILPGIDDGSRNLEMTLNMLKIASSEGVTHMIATPHFKINHRNASTDIREKLLKEIENLARENDIPIRLYLGNEVMFFNDLESVYADKEICTMNGTDYLLIEFYPDDEFMKIRRGLETVFELGLIPVLAHAERYTALRKSIPNTKLLADMGVIISVNASSLAGQLGFSTKWYIKKLIKNKIVSLVSSDAHDDTRRTPSFKECCRYLQKISDEEYIKDILFRNAVEFFELETK